MKIAREYKTYYSDHLSSSISDINLAYECENECASEMFECIVECGTNTECTSACYRGNTACIDACPCHAGNFYQETLGVFC